MISLDSKHGKSGFYYKEAIKKQDVAQEMVIMVTINLKMEMMDTFL